MSDLQHEGYQVSQSCEGGRRKRPRVAEENRQRASRACDGCRSVKEKCQGGTPCQRCTRLQRVCKYSASTSRQDNAKPGRNSSMSTVNQDDDRTKHMERIISHFLGDVPLDLTNLQRIAEKIDDRRGELCQDQPDELAINEESFTVKALSHSTAHYSGEFSHWNFSQRIRRKIDEHSGRVNAEISLRLRMDFMKDSIDREFWRASQLHLPDTTTQKALACLPPRPIAEFLIQTFMRYVQHNYFFVEETWLQSKLHACYEPSSRMSVDDAAWVCSLLMALAIGTQFAHMAAATSNPSAQSRATFAGDEDASGEEIGIAFYHEACKLIPDMLILASVESAQAFMLLASYTLPRDAQGLGYTYLGLSVKMCVQNGMHRKQTVSTLTPAAMELRRRLWWTAYSLDKRISILHGRPASMVHSDVDADTPFDLPEFRTGGGPSQYQNMCAIINITNRLGDIAYVINLLRRCPKSLQNEYIGRLLDIREKTESWWKSLPEKVVCRDLTPSCPLFRANVHLKMSLHLNQVYMGRPFLFHHSNVLSPATPTQQTANWSVLATDCIDGALGIIELCGLLQENTGLARGSYTEFSSCRAALLAIIAQSLNEQSERLRIALAHGLDMIRRMMVGFDSAKAEVAVIEALANATRRLTTGSEEVVDARAAEVGKGYDYFKSWAVSVSSNSRDGEQSDTFGISDPSGSMQPDPFADLTDLDLNALLASFPLEQGGFGPLSPFLNE